MRECDCAEIQLITNKSIIINKNQAKKSMKKLLTMLFLLAFAWTSYAQLSTESFDAATFPPTGWTNVSSGPVFSYVTAGTYPTTTPHSGAGFIKFNSYSVSSGTALLTSPALNLVTNPTLSVSFWMYRDNGFLTNADKIDVFVNNSASVAGATNIGTVNRSINLAPTVAANGWYQYTFAIPAGFSTSTAAYVMFQGTSTWGNNIYLDDIALPFAAPGLAGIGAPANGATGVLTNAGLSWSAPTTAGPVYGYKVYFGTDAAATNLANGTIVTGTTFTPAAAMAYNTLHYWKIVPYNGKGDAAGAATWSFTTSLGVGSLQGTVNNFNGVPVNGATVGAVGPATYSTTTNAAGFYQFLTANAGTYTVGAQAATYNTTTIPGVFVAPSATTTQNIVLLQPTMNIAPDPNAVTVSPNEVLNNPFVITNLGTGVLGWTASIGNWSSANHSWFSMPTLSGSVNAGQIVNVPAIFNATGLAVGTLLSADVTFVSTPNVGTKVVPVRMVVAGNALVPVTNLEGTLTDQFTGAVTLTWECTPSAGFLYYNVKRDGTILAVLPAATSYNDVLPTYGNYVYCVDAVYTDGNTAPVCVTVEWPNPTMTWAPAALAATVWSGNSKNLPMTIGNTGLGTLAFEFPDYVDNNGDSPLAYCASTSTSTSFEYISNVQFGTINNASGRNNYANYTALTTDVEINVATPITVTINGSFSSDITVVWIDYNHNNTFDASEMTTLVGTTPAAGSITVPMTALPGPTTMRVQMADGGTSGNPCATFTWGEVEDYTVNIKAPSFITAVAPASGFVAAGGTQAVTVTFSATGLFTAAGVYNNTLKLNSNDLAHASVSIPATMTVTVPGTITGTVTDCVSGDVLPGAMVQAGAFTAMTNDDGVYEMLVDAGTYSVVFSKIGYQNVTVAGQVATAGNTTTVNAMLCETPYAPSCASAEVNAEDTQATVTWCVPAGPYELLYDDGTAENYAAWQLPGNMNAVKFTPKGYPAKVVGGKFYVGDGSFPAGGNFMGKDFAVEVFKADGPSGMPGTKIDSTGVTVNSYGWINVTGLNANIVAGDFYLVMVQLSTSPDCVPIGVDESLPKAYKSYSRNVGTNSPWALSPYQDFMMHAVVSSPLTGDDDNAVAARTLAPQKVAGMISLTAPMANPGLEMTTAQVTAPEGYDNMDAVHHYSLSRLAGFDPNVALPGAATLTLINNNLTATTYQEGGTTWGNLAMGWYAYGVKAVYPNGNESAMVYTNAIPHKLFADVTINVQLVCGFVPAEGATVTLTGLDYPYDVLTAVVPASGTVVFDNVIKGHYTLLITRAGYYAYEMNLNITGNKTLTAVMEDLRYMPRNLFVDDMTLVATWDEPLATAITENFEGGVFPPAGWQALTQGTIGWYATANGSSGGFSVPAHTNYAISNDDSEGSANNGCCDYLITPELDLTAAPAYVLSFQSFYTGAYSQLAFVEMSTDAGASWTPIYTVSAAGSWQQVDVDLSAFSGAAGLSSVWFAFHADDAGEWASGWAIDDVTIASGGIPIQGYGVFLDATEVGQTPDLTWTYDPTTINYGQTYVAGVAALYCSGYSDLCTYTFTSHFLYPPRNLEAQANVSTTSGAAILTWQPPLSGDFAVSGSVPRTGTLNPNMEYSPNVTLHTGTTNDAMWDELFAYQSAGVSQAGVETDGNFIYTSVWNSGDFYKYDLSGNLVESFTVAGASNIRDLAYDGQFFYGSDATANLKKMDFTNKVLVGTIATGASAGIRHIGYDPNLDGGNGGFWCGNWSNLAQIKKDGSLIQNVSAFNLTGCYGTAVDPINNKVWFHDQGGNGVDLWEFDAATLSFTGVMHDASTVTGFDPANGIAGGLAYSNLVVSGKWVLMGLVQQAPTIVYGFDMGAAAPGPENNLVSYNLYRDDVIVANIPKTENEYWDLNLMPATYCYDITAVYDLTPYGFPGTTGESIKEGTACVDLFYGFDLPFTEDFTTGQFDVNLWTVGQNWVMDGQQGNPMPSAKFKWDPLLTDYSSSLESFYLNGASVNTTTPYKIWMDFDVKLDDRTASTNEKLTVELWNGSSWSEVKEYANNGDFDWTTEHINISGGAKNNVFKVRFRANGDLTGDLFYWAVDNIHIYAGYEFNPPLNLVATSEPTTPKNDIRLNWEVPAGGGTIMEFKIDDGTAENGWAINPAAEAWLGNEFAITETGVLQSVDLYWMANAAAGSDLVTLDIFDASQNIIGSTAPFAPVADAWQTVALADVPFSGAVYAMVHWNNLAGNTNYLGSDEDGPNAAANYGWYYDGTAWDHLSSFGYAPNVFLISLKALVDGDKKVVTYGPASSSSNAAANLMAVKADRSANTGRYVASAPQFQGDNSDGLTGYNVYRRAYAKFPAGVNTGGTGDFTMIATVTETTYLDMNLSNLVTNCYEYQVTANYDEGMSIPSNIDWECIFVGIDENANEVKVYPNPATTYVRIDLTKEVSNVKVYNALGSVVAEKEVKGESTITLNTSNYAAGAYSVKFTTASGETFSRKFVVTK